MQEDSGDIIYSTELDLEGGIFYVTVIIDVEFDVVSIFLNSPIKVNLGKRLEIAEFISRVNYKNYEGSFILNFEDGNLAYKYAIRFNPDEDCKHLKHQLNLSLGLAIDELEMYFLGILSIIYSDVSPAEAISKAKLGSNHKLN